MYCKSDHILVEEMIVQCKEQYGLLNGDTGKYVEYSV